MQDLECSEGIPCINNSENNDSNKGYASDDISEQIELNDNSDDDSHRDDLSQNNSEGMGQNNNSEVNYSNEEDLSEIFSSQENISSRKLFFNASRNSGWKMKKVKKLNCKRGGKGKSASGWFASCVNVW